MSLFYALEVEVTWLAKGRPVIWFALVATQGTTVYRWDCKYSFAKMTALQLKHNPCADHDPPLGRGLPRHRVVTRALCQIYPAWYLRASALIFYKPGKIWFSLGKTRNFSIANHFPEPCIKLYTQLWSASVLSTLPVGICAHISFSLSPKKNWSLFQVFPWLFWFPASEWLGWCALPTNFAAVSCIIVCHYSHAVNFVQTKCQDFFFTLSTICSPFTFEFE